MRRYLSQPDSAIRVVQIVFTSLLLAPVSLLPTTLDLTGRVSLLCAAALWACYFANGIRISRAPSQRRARPVLLVSVLYLPLLLLMLVADSHSQKGYE